MVSMIRITAKVTAKNITKPMRIIMVEEKIEVDSVMALDRIME
jgi:hypothetical protein